MGWTSLLVFSLQALILTGICHGLQLGYIQYEGLLISQSFMEPDFRCNCSCLAHIDLNKPAKEYDRKMQCHCECNKRANMTMDSPELKQRLRELKQDLTIPKHNTDKYKRERISIYENRLIPKTVGVAGMIVILTIVVFAIIADIPHFKAVAKIWYKTMKMCLRKKGDNSLRIRVKKQSSVNLRPRKKK